LIDKTETTNEFDLYWEDQRHPMILNFNGKGQ